ncbi:MAG: beta strand repeat-containing protein [Limisphaerales bacterium]
MTIQPLHLSNTFAAGAFTLIRQRTSQLLTLGLLLSALSAAAQPAIGTQPLSRTNNIGDNATFSVTATGTGTLTYQWRRNGNNLTGSTDSALSIAVTNVANAGTYTVVVTDTTALSTTSSSAVLSVFFAERIKFTQWNFNSTTPDNSVTTGIASPSVGTGVVNAVGGPTANGFNFGSSSDPNTSDNSSRRWNALTSTMANKTAGAKYAVSTAGYDNIAFTGELWLTTRSSAYWRGQYTTDGTTWIDRGVISRHAASLGGFYYFADDLTGVSGVADNTNFAYQIVAEYESTATGSGSAAYVSLDPASTFNSSSSLFGWDMVTLFGTAISQQPAITLQPQSHTNYVNTGGGFSVKATGGNLFYQWYFNGSSIGTGTNADLVISNVQYSDAGTYRVVVNNTAGSVTSDDAFLTVDSVVLPQGDRYWSGDGVTAGGAGSGGNWNTNTPNRWGTDIGGPFNLQWNNANLDNAIFPAGSGVITNSSGVAVNKILVTNAAGAAYVFGGTGRLSFLGPDSSIYIAGGNTANASNLLSSTCEFAGSVITKSGGGRLHLDNTNSNVGRWVVNQGSLTGSGPTNLFGSQPTQSLSNYITLDGGGLGFIAGAAMSLGANRGIYLGPGGGQIGNQGTGGIITVDAPITGPGSLHFPGTTEWPSQLQGDNCVYIISNTNNNYLGITRIATSEVRCGANQVFPATTTLIISNLSLNGRLNLNGFNQTVAKVILDSTTGSSRIIDTVGTGSLTAAEFDLRRSANASADIGAVLAGSGTLTKTTSGTISLGAANTYSGDTFLQAGTLTLLAGGRFGNGAGTLHLQGATLTVPDSRTDATAIINPTSLEAETLVQGTPNATNHILFIHGGTWTMVGGAFYIFNPNTNGYLFQVALTNTFNFSLPIDIGSGCHLVSYNPVGSDQTFSGGISGAGVFRRAVSSGSGGRAIFATDNTYSGGTLITSGTLLANNPSGSATGSGAVTVTAAGVLGGTGTISGSVAVTNGGNLLAAAAGGVLTLQGGLDMSGSGTNTWELTALQDSSTGTAGTSFGQVVLTAGELQLGGSSVLSLSFSGGTAPDSSVPFWQSTRHWKIINLAGGLNTANASFASIANGSYSAGNFSTAVDGSGNIILTFTASAQSAPGITSHPQSRTTVAGTTASFTVAANGSQPLTYAWFRSTAPFTPIPGATNTTLTLTNVQAASAGSYFARAYNGLGNDTSQFALLTVVPPPAIQPLFGAGTTNVVVTWNTAVGNQYQLQYNTNLATANWIPMTTFVGAGGSVSVTNHPPVGDPQRYYRVIIW